MTLETFLAILGIALGLIFGFAPYVGIAKMPTWASQAGVASGILVVVFAAGLYFGSQRKSVGASPVLKDSAELRLHFYGDDRPPTRIFASNIWRWYYLRNMFVTIDKNTGKEQRYAIPNLFISFDEPVKVGTLEVIADFKLPLYEVKEFTNRFAIIAFSGDLPAGDLNITVR